MKDFDQSVIQAIKLVIDGIVKRVDVDDEISVYAVGKNLVRIDIKVEVK